MKQYTYDSFSELRNEYKKMIYGIETAFPSLRRLQQRIAETRAGGTYTVETPVVYNTALDAFTVHDEIKLILVGDNPGRREQEERNRAYLVGNSGKLAASFFGRFPELGIDFRKNVLILNKTPVHTARTNELLELTASGGDELVRIVRKSQEDCARLLFQFWNIVSHDTPVPVWIIGYSEMKKKGIFETYTAELARLARQDSRFYQSLYFYRHFSMNQFTIDLNKKRAPGESVQNALARIGKEYRF
ncbi:MAG: hypothetical protein LBG74_08730, partial [Spirochaetaceae bacterium]|nr:hypothetical protein [Spirochaetaceae bacterium]